MLFCGFKPLARLHRCRLMFESFSHLQTSKTHLQIAGDFVPCELLDNFYEGRLDSFDEKKI